VAAKFSPPIQTSPGAHPATRTMGTSLLPENKVARHGIDHPPLSWAMVREREDLYLLPFWDFMPVRG